MMHIPKGRYAAQIKGDFVVFLIGMRINRLLLSHKWLPIVFAMSRMLKELAKHPELGMLHAQTFVSGRTVLVVQYWRGFDQLHAYAHSKNLEHLPAWTAFNRKVGGLNQQRSYWDFKYEQGLPSLEKSQTFFLSAFGQFVEDQFPDGQQHWTWPEGLADMRSGWLRNTGRSRSSTTRTL